MAKPELTFFQVQRKCMFGDAIELSQSTFDKAPERLISLQLTLQWLALCTVLQHSNANTQVNGINTSNRNTAQSAALCSRQIQRKMTYNLSEFGFAKFRTPVISIFINHFKKLACIDYMFAS